MIPRSVRYVAGIDEVGRGPIAGPVTLGLVVVRRGDLRHPIFRRNWDSKRLPVHKRESGLLELRGLVARDKMQLATASVGAKHIDKRGIVHAVNTGIRRMLIRADIDPSETLLLLDGSLRAPGTYEYQRTVVGGDSSEAIIGMASVVAKVARDKYMRRKAKLFPEYGFENHVGYGTSAHYKALKRHGPCELHRQSFIKSI